MRRGIGLELGTVHEQFAEDVLRRSFFRASIVERTDVGLDGNVALSVL